MVENEFLHSLALKQTATRSSVRKRWRGLAKTRRRTEPVLRVSVGRVNRKSRGAFVSLAGFYRSVMASLEELEAMIRAGGFDEFGQARTRRFWEGQRFVKAEGRRLKAEVGSENLEFDFEAGTNPVSDFFAQNPALLRDKNRTFRVPARAPVPRQESIPRRLCRLAARPVHRRCRTTQ